LDGVAADHYARLPQAERPTSFAAMVTMLRNEFQPKEYKTQARMKLKDLHQDKRSVHQYAVEFRRLHAIVGTTSVVDQVFNFIQGLKPNLRDRLAQMEKPPATVDEAVSLASRKEAYAQSPVSHLKQAMDLSALDTEAAQKVYELFAMYSTRNERGYDKPRYDSSSGVTPEQIAQRRANRECFHCGSKDHIKRDCPKLKGAAGFKPSSKNSKSSGN